VSDVKNPPADLLSDLQSPTGKRRQIRVPPMPKEVAERLKKLDVAPTLVQGDKTILGTPKPPEESAAVETYPDIPEVDRAEFLAHILGAPHFKKSYELFGGAVRLTFRTRTASEDEACARAAQKAVPEPTIPDKITAEARTLSAQAGADRLRKYREFTMIVSLCDLSFDGKAPIPTLFDKPVAESDVAAVYNEFVSTLAGTLLGTVRLYHDRFETLTNIMLTLADKPGFWKAASAR
jgi:hypothetical protein